MPRKRQEEEYKERGSKSRLKFETMKSREWRKVKLRATANFSCWIDQCSQKEQVRRKSIISGGKGQDVVQRETIEKDLEGKKQHTKHSLVKTDWSDWTERAYRRYQPENKIAQWKKKKKKVFQRCRNLVDFDLGKGELVWHIWEGSQRTSGVKVQLGALSQDMTLSKRLSDLRKMKCKERLK